MATPSAFTIEGGTLIFRNFAGAEGKYNVAGDRNFAVILPQDIADQMLADGWSVKYLTPREDEDGVETRTPYLAINVSYKNRPPRILLLTESTRVNITEDTVGVLDWTDIKNADMVVNPFAWDVGGKQGIKAYLKSLYVTAEEDDLDRKYADSQAIE
jgi:hypothetical protein